MNDRTIMGILGGFLAGALATALVLGISNRQLNPVTPKAESRSSMSPFHPKLTPSLMGDWVQKTTLNGVPLTCHITFNPNGSFVRRYVQEYQTGNTEVMQPGNWSYVDGRLRFSSTIGNGLNGDYYFRFNSSTLTLQDENGVIDTLQRG